MLLSANGLPEQLVTEDSSQFELNIWASLASALHMLLNVRIGTYPYHTSANGLVERFMQTFKVALWQRKMVSYSHTAWLVYCMHLIIADYYY